MLVVGLILLYYFFGDEEFCRIYFLVIPRNGVTRNLRFFLKSVRTRDSSGVNALTPRSDITAQ